MKSCLRIYGQFTYYCISFRILGQNMVGYRDACYWIVDADALFPLMFSSVRNRGKNTIQPFFIYLVLCVLLSTRLLQLSLILPVKCLNLPMSI